MAGVHGCLLFPFPSQTLYCQFLEGRFFFFFFGLHYSLSEEVSLANTGCSIITCLMNAKKMQVIELLQGAWECNNTPLTLLQLTTTMPGRHFNPLNKEENRKS